MSNNPTDGGTVASEASASASTTYSFSVQVYEDTGGISPLFNEISVDVETTEGGESASKRAEETAIEYVESEHPSLPIHSVETMLVDVHIKVNNV